nr:hypothetical protein BaRGS_009243 [Batillaria attramentaria]
MREEYREDYPSRANKIQAFLDSTIERYEERMKELQFDLHIMPERKRRALHECWENKILLETGLQLILPEPRDSYDRDEQVDRYLQMDARLVILDAMAPRGYKCNKDEDFTNLETDSSRLEETDSVPQGTDSSRQDPDSQRSGLRTETDSTIPETDSALQANDSAAQESEVTEDLTTSDIPTTFTDSSVKAGDD